MVLSQIKSATPHQADALGLLWNSVEWPLTRNEVLHVVDAWHVEYIEAEDGSGIVSSISTTDVGLFVGVSFVATRPDHQRQGLATGLLKHVQARFRDSKPLALMASEAGLGLYLELGFGRVRTAKKFELTDVTSHRLSTIAQADDITYSLAQTDDDFAQMVELTNSASGGADLSRFYSTFLRPSAGQKDRLPHSYLAKRGDEVVGFGSFYRLFDNLWLGPLICQEAAVAQGIVSRLIALRNEEQPEVQVNIHCLEPVSSWWADWLVEQGFRLASDWPILQHPAAKPIFDGYDMARYYAIHDPVNM